MYKLFVLSLKILIVLGEDPVSVMKSFTEYIGDVVLECQSEMRVPDYVLIDFLLYWNTRHVINNKMQGCVVACVLNKLALVGQGGPKDPLNIEAFMENNRADPQTTSTIKKLFKLCKKAAFIRTKRRRLMDGCILALEISKCFRYGIFSLEWTPTLEAFDAYEQEQEEVTEEEILTPLLDAAAVEQN